MTYLINNKKIRIKKCYIHDYFINNKSGVEYITTFFQTGETILIDIWNTNEYRYFKSKSNILRDGSFDYQTTEILYDNENISWTELLIRIQNDFTKLPNYGNLLIEQCEYTAKSIIQL